MKHSRDEAQRRREVAKGVGLEGIGGKGGEVSIRFEEKARGEATLQLDSDEEALNSEWSDEGAQNEDEDIMTREMEGNEPL